MTPTIPTLPASSLKPIELLDCGRAADATKGSPIGIIYEFSWPPFDKQLIL